MMETSQERDASTVDSLFYLIINDMKCVAPIWEDFVTKTNKFHSSLRLTIQSMSSYLDVFQKIADTATHSKGASKDIGTVLTRVCLRQKSVENRLKSFTLSLMNSLIIPLQSQLDEWHRDTQLLERNYSKQQKRGRADLKKYSSDTIRLKKKNKKGQTDTIQSLIETSMKTMHVKNDEIATLERTYLRDVMVDERRRYCVFVNMLQPVVKEGCEIMFELGHLQEAMDSIANVIQNQNSLPSNIENKIEELKLSSGNDFPLVQQSINSSIGSRKNSGSSINSFISNDSRESNGLNTQRSVSQASSAASSNVLSAWPTNVPDSISYLSSHDTMSSNSSTHDPLPKQSALADSTFQNSKSATQTLSRPPLPIRCSSLERERRDAAADLMNPSKSTTECTIPKSYHSELSCARHTYVNTMDYCSKANDPLKHERVLSPQNLPVPAKETLSVYPISNGAIGHNIPKTPLDSTTCSKIYDNPFGELNGVGSVLKKLTIFEKIKLLNADCSQDEPIEAPQVDTPFKRDKEMATFISAKKSEVLPETTTPSLRTSTRVKPAPPVRRSSSVTPSSNYGFKSSFDASTENIPYALPPADNFLRSPGKVCNTIKALVDKCQIPISPGTIRRNSVITNAHSIYNTAPSSTFSPLQTSVTAKHTKPPDHLSSFKNNMSDTTLPKTYASLYGPTDTTDKHKDPHQNRPKPYFKPSINHGINSEVIYAMPNELASSLKPQPSPNYTNPKTNIAILSKRERTESLKSELDLSQKAFAVRKLINRQAVADPRQCHESLMSQIKRGTTLHSSKSIKGRKPNNS